jgi:hypothetical protein
MICNIIKIAIQCQTDLFISAILQTITYISAFSISLKAVVGLVRVIDTYFLAVNLQRKTKILFMDSVWSLACAKLQVGIKAKDKEQIGKWQRYFYRFCD